MYTKIDGKGGGFSAIAIFTCIYLASVQVHQGKICIQIYRKFASVQAPLSQTSLKLLGSPKKLLLQIINHHTRIKH